MVQSRFNNGGWTDDDYTFEEKKGKFTFVYKVNLEEGYKYINNKTIILPVNIDMNSNQILTQQDFANAIAEAKNWVNTFNVQIKVTLIPAEKVEKIFLKK